MSRVATSDKLNLSASSSDTASKKRGLHAGADEGYGDATSQVSPSVAHKKPRQDLFLRDLNRTSTQSPSPKENYAPATEEAVNSVYSTASHTSNGPTTYSLSQAVDRSLAPSMAGQQYALTPLTNSDSSPVGRGHSPQRGKNPLDGVQSRQHDVQQTTMNVSEAHVSILTPPETLRSARPGPGLEKGTKLIWDPELDEKLPAKERKRHKPKYKVFGVEADGIPPPDPRLAIAGYTEGHYNRKGAQNKAKFRPTPYIAKMHARDPRNDDETFTPAKQIVITGLDPLTPESQIRAAFGTYGEIAEFSNQADPASGSFLGICLIRYVDSKPLRGTPIAAVAAALRAEKECSGQKIGTNIVKVQLDRTGKLCERLVKDRIVRTRARREKEIQMEKKLKADASSVPPAPPLETSLGPPPDAPKGPSGRAAPLIPALARQPVQRPRIPNMQSALVEPEPILPKLKRKPYVFIAGCYVPIMSTTIAHLQKRLRSYDVREIRLDQTGYYVVFEDSKRGEDECARVFKECHMCPLFTYVMNMECQQYGNPNYERSPSPERVLAEKKKREERERLWREDELDFEEEKRQRAEALDPVMGAIEILKQQLAEIVMSDVRSKIAGPALYDLLSPDRHVEKRRKHNIEDPQVKDVSSTLLPFNRGDLLSAVPSGFSRGYGPGRGRGGRFERGGRRGQHGHHLLDVKPANAFLDERRKRPPPSRKPAIQSLHRRLMHFDESDDDSDDEKRTVRTRDSEEQESRPISRASPAPSKLGPGDATPRRKRRGVEAAWGADSDDEQIEAIARRSLGHLLGKEPEDMANHELEQILCTLPRSSQLRQRAAAEVKLRKRAAEEDDVLFFGKSSTPSAVDVQMDDATSVDASVATPEPESVAKASRKKPAVARPKKKTKKELLAEAAALKAKAKAEGLAPEAIQDDLEKLVPVEVQWGISRGVVRRTVEDDISMIMDIDGWQQLIKDDEDLRLLREVLKDETTTIHGDVDLWAYKQKQIKLLNNGGVSGPVYSPPKIDGYYVPSATGSARTDGFKKILQSEKSKYLPHRLRVQREREEREKKARLDPNASAEAAKIAAAKTAATATSRANRLTNRRLAHDITLQKTTFGIESDSLRFNQLLKRKKNVRFDRSAIHNWGLYAGEDIQNNDFIIEYVGEKVRQRVANLREDRYLRQGIGSSYLFRIGDDAVIDATKKGGIARFINHSCTPNCTAKIIRSEGTLRICIYSCRDIAKDEELTYDYKFEREINSDDRIPCLCGSVGCKGFLN